MPPPKHTSHEMYPFTPAQWQELEHQALIYKYMASGIPVPPEFLFAIKRSCLDTSLTPKQFTYPSPPLGWSCFPVSLGRKIDPEPGRCRRTDGKKWRCSKDAFPDSKYCEKHMHRGKNRSRKLVELGTIQPTNAPHSATTSSLMPSNAHHVFNYEFLPNPSSSFAGVDVRSKNPSASEEDAWQLAPLTMSSSCSSNVSSSKQTGLHDFSYLQSFDYNGAFRRQFHEKYGMEDGLKEQQQKTVHRFFDEWPPKNKASCLEVDDRSSVSTTKLSISVPSSSNEFNIFSRNQCSN